MVGQGSLLCSGHRSPAKPSFPLSSFYRRTHAYRDSPTTVAGPQLQRRRKETEQGLEAWGSQSLGCPPSAKVRQKTVSLGRRWISPVGTSGRPGQANKYYLQTGRRSRGGGSRDSWAHRLWRSPTSSTTGQVRLEERSLITQALHLRPEHVKGARWLQSRRTADKGSRAVWTQHSGRGCSLDTLALPGLPGGPPETWARAGGTSVTASPDPHRPESGVSNE